MSLFSYEDKEDWRRALDNLWSYKYLYQAGIDISGLPVRDYAYEKMLQRCFEVASITGLEDVQSESGYDVFRVTITDKRFIEISEISMDTFVELAAIINELFGLDIWDYDREYAPFISFDWLKDDKGRIYGVTLIYEETSDMYSPEIKVFVKLIQKITEVLHGHRNRN